MVLYMKLLLFVQKNVLKKNENSVKLLQKFVGTTILPLNPMYLEERGQGLLLNINSDMTSINNPRVFYLRISDDHCCEM